MLRDNPFQVVGLLASAAEKERQHQASRIRAFLEVGKPLSFEEEILFHGCRRNSTTAGRALKDHQDARLRWQSRLRRFDHLVRALPDGGGFSICEGLWDWARKRKQKDPDFNVSVAIRWCGNQYATRVIPLLESMWKMSVRFPSLEAATETVRLQVGKRMRTAQPRVIPVAGSLVDRLDALLEDEQEHVQEQEWKGHSDYSELTSGDIVAYVFAGLFLLWILSLIMS